MFQSVFVPAPLYNGCCQQIMWLHQSPKQASIFRDHPQYDSAAAANRTLMSSMTARWPCGHLSSLSGYAGGWRSTWPLAEMNRDCIWSECVIRHVSRKRMKLNLCCCCAGSESALCNSIQHWLFKRNHVEGWSLKALWITEKTGLKMPSMLLCASLIYNKLQQVDCQFRQGHIEIFLKHENRVNH